MCRATFKWAQTEQVGSSANGRPVCVCVCVAMADNRQTHKVCVISVSLSSTINWQWWRGQSVSSPATSRAPACVSKCQPASLQFAAHSHTYISPAAHTKALSVQRRPGGRKEVNDSALCAHQFNSTRSRGRKSFGRSPAVPADGWWQLLRDLLSCCLSLYCQR